MISVCIPIYNVDVRMLVHDLVKEIKQGSLPVHVILIDDSSNVFFRNINIELQDIATYIQLKENIGRSRIRNLFLEHANYDWLLFLDCDAGIADDLFLSRYLQAINIGRPDVICGGLKYKEGTPQKNKLLRWKYGMCRESLDLKRRLQEPYQSFRSINFLIAREVFERIHFNEVLTGYGHEDTLFAWELNKNNIPVLHIDNPVYHLGVETNEVFLEKTREGIRNLLNLERSMAQFETFGQEVRLMKVVNRIRGNRWYGILEKLLVNVTPVIERVLEKGYINLKLFDLYKLGYLLTLQKKMGRDRFCTQN